MIWRYPEERRRFVKFAVVGTLGAGVDFGVFNLLTGLLAVPAVAASVVSFLMAVLHNFLWNRYWTYPEARGKSVAQQGVQFAVVSVIGLVIRTPLFALLEHPLVGLFVRWGKGLPLGPTFWGHNLALAVVIGVVMVWNFLANRFWTFNDVALGA